MKVNIILNAIALIICVVGLNVEGQKPTRKPTLKPTTKTPTNKPTTADGRPCTVTEPCPSSGGFYCRIDPLDPFKVGTCVKTVCPSDVGCEKWTNQCGVECNCAANNVENVVSSCPNPNCAESSQQQPFCSRIRDDSYDCIAESTRVCPLGSVCQRQDSGQGRCVALRCDAGCKLEYDGCNTCRCGPNGELINCSTIICQVYAKPQCLEYGCNDQFPCPSDQGRYCDLDYLPTPPENGTLGNCVTTRCPGECRIWNNGCNRFNCNKGGALGRIIGKRKNCPARGNPYCEDGQTKSPTAPTQIRCQKIKKNRPCNRSGSCRWAKAKKRCVPLAQASAEDLDDSNDDDEEEEVSNDDDEDDLE